MSRAFGFLLRLAVSWKNADQENSTARSLTFKRSWLLLLLLPFARPRHCFLNSSSRLLRTATCCRRAETAHTGGCVGGE
jgi:hypothetical protein